MHQTIPVFKYALHTGGTLHSAYVFETKQQMERFVHKDFRRIQEKYPGTVLQGEEELPGFKLGDKCHVWGEGMDVFTIVGVKKYEEHRYGYELKEGWIEGVHKCYALSEEEFEAEQRAEKAARLIPGRWVSVKERLPTPNKEVPVLTGGGREAVGWYGDGSWAVIDDSGYDWYKQVVVAWYDVPTPTMEQIANWM